jgi:hypothetical protein
MKRWSLSWGLALWLATLSASVRADLHCAAPEAQVGEIKSGAPLTYRYRVVNRGPGIVEVMQLRTSCGCVVPHLEQRMLSPGETTEVALVVNTLAQGAGDRAWSLTLVYETEGQQAELPLTLRGRVVSEIRVEPTALHVVTDTTVTQLVQVTDLRPQPLNVTAVHSSAPWIRAQLGDTVRDVNHLVQNVQVEISADCPEGRRDEMLHLVTDDPAYPDLQVPVTITKRNRGRVRAFPEEVDLTGAGPGPLPPRLVRLSTADEQTILVERVEADHPAVSCRWAPGPGPNATVRVEVDGSKVGADGLHTVVHVQLRGPTAETLAIPVVCPPR